MITERLQAAIESAAQLPAEAQDKVASQLESAVRNALWDAELNDPQFDQVLDELIARAEAQEPLPFPRPEGWTDEEEGEVEQGHG
ncbi:MAG TPA: hypothetical protein VF116_00230 [Ktedonobacterales bacterium]